MKDINRYKLTGDTTVGQLKNWVSILDDEAKEKIVVLIDHRFRNRYLKHAEAAESGFLKMALACLLIEALQSFKQGINNTKGRSQEMFRNFFSEESLQFPGFAEIADDFYINIRCGILHQAETTNAWRILLPGKILDQKTYAIGSRNFLTSLKKSLDNYTNTLRQEEVSSHYWKNAIRKLEDICDNCNRRP